MFDDFMVVDNGESSPKNPLNTDYGVEIYEP
jgi:hypothetical protein